MLGSIIAATPEHAKAMAPHMRAAEVREIAADCGLTPEPALLSELDRSIAAWSWVIDGEVVCMFGVVLPYLFSEESYPWFLTTHLVDVNYVAFARACRALLPEMLARHPRMVGMVDARYGLSIRWLRWLGAKIGAPQPWGIAGELFCRFELGVKTWA